MKKVKELKEQNPQLGLVLLIVFGFALPVVAGIAVYKVVKKMKHKADHALEIDDIGENAEEAKAEMEAYEEIEVSDGTVEV